MMNYKVFEVGDALFSVFTNQIGQTTEEHKSVFDFGFSHIDDFKNIEIFEYKDAETFVISHFHLDHYKGFTKVANNSLNFKKLIIPKLPKNKELADSMIAFMTIQLYFLGSETGNYEADLLRRIREKNQSDFEIERVKRDDDFIASTTNFKVLWPDENFLSSSVVIQKALEKINNVKSQNEAFKKFSDDVENSTFWKTDDKISRKESAIKYDFNLTNEQKETLKSANTSLIRIANDICLAFEEVNKSLLFLGDLSDDALDALFEIDFNDKVTYDAVLSSHHGTHSSINKKWKNIKTYVVITSGGIQRLRKFRGAYFLWSNRQHHTCCKGTFNSLQYRRICNINNIIK
jgi:beta-lactamase superfamily II metal-dependent hydrolase